MLIINVKSLVAIASVSGAVLNLPVSPVLAASAKSIELWGDPTFETKGGLRSQHSEHYRLAITSQVILIASNVGGALSGSGFRYSSVRVGPSGGYGCTSVKTERVCFRLSYTSGGNGSLRVDTTAKVNGGVVNYRTDFSFQDGGASCSAQINNAQRTYWDEPGVWYSPVAGMSDTTCHITF